MTDGHVRGVAQIARSLLETVKERQAQGGVEIVGMPTGFAKVDDWTDGLQPDAMWLVGATTSGGKSSWALDVALHVAKRDQPVLFYALEMSGEAMVARLLSKISGIPAIRIKRGKLNEIELETVAKAAQRLSGTKVSIIDQTFTSATLCEHAKRTADELGAVGLVVVDYAQILRDADTHGAASRVAGISINIRSLARPDQLNVPVILVSQLNREHQKRDDKRPLISDFKESSQLEQDAEVAILLHRPEAGGDHQEVEDAEIIVAKNRNGPTGVSHAKFYPKSMTWVQQKPEPIQPKSLSDSTSWVKKAQEGR